MTLTGPRAEPLLSPKKVAVIWLASLSILYQVVAVSCHAHGYWRELIPGGFAIGHASLAYVLARGRLLSEGRIGRRWTDVATALGALWIGPAWWYYECTFSLATLSIGHGSA